MPTHITSGQIKQVQAALAMRRPACGSGMTPSLKTIAAQTGVGRSVVGEIANGTYHAMKQRRARKRKRANRIIKRVMGRCPVCRCKCLVPCIACEARAYQKRQQEIAALATPK